MYFQKSLIIYAYSYRDLFEVSNIYFVYINYYYSKIIYSMIIIYMWR